MTTRIINASVEHQSVKDTIIRRRRRIAGDTVPRPPRSSDAEAINADVVCRAVRFLAGDSASRPSDRALFARNFRAVGPAYRAFGGAPENGTGAQGKPFKDVRLDIRDVDIAENSAVVHLNFAGRHAGPYQGCPATGRQMEANGVVLLRFDRGCVVEASSLLHWRPATPRVRALSETASWDRECEGVEPSQPGVTRPQRF